MEIIRNASGSSGPIEGTSILSTAEAAGLVLTSDGSGGASWQAVAGTGTVTGTGAAGQISYWTGASAIAGNSNFLFDTTDQSMRLGTTGVLSILREKFSLRLTADVADAAQGHAALYAQYINARNTAFTNDQRAAVFDWRRTITASTTDTGAQINAVRVEPIFTVTGGGVVYTLANTYSALQVVGPSLSGGGTLAITRYYNLEIPANSTNTGGIKVGLFVGTQSGSTTANIGIGDTGAASASGTYNIYMSAANPSVLGGTLTATGFIVGNYQVGPLEQDAGNSGTSDTIDLSLGSSIKSTLTGNVTYTLTNPVTGGTYVFRILTGAGSFTTTWPATVKWSASQGAYVTTTTASRMDLVSLYWDGTNYYGSYVKEFTP